MLVGCFLAAVAHPDHVAELAMFDKLPSAARMAVGRFFSFFLAGGLDDAGREKRHCCKVSDEAAFCLIQRPYISKTLLTRRISPRGSP